MFDLSQYSSTNLLALLRQRLKTTFKTVTIIYKLMQ